MSLPRFYPHPVIAKEGWPFIFAGLILSIIVSSCAGWWSLPFWVYTIFAVQFFRDPSRPIPQEPDAVLSPADGRIVVVEKATDPYRGVEALKISVFMNVFNVHSQRSPIDGTVTRVEYNKGKFVNAALNKASTENERNAVFATTRTGREVTFVQVAGLVARRILCYVKTGESVVRGERYGFIRFGSRVDVYLPADAQAQVAIGDKVKASSTILARLPLQAPEVMPSEHAEPAAAAPEVESSAANVVPEAVVSETEGNAAPEAAEHEAPEAAAPASDSQHAASLPNEQEVIEQAAEQVRQAVSQQKDSL